MEKLVGQSGMPIVCNFEQRSTEKNTKELPNPKRPSYAWDRRTCQKMTLSYLHILFPLFFYVTFYQQNQFPMRTSSLFGIIREETGKACVRMGVFTDTAELNCIKLAMLNDFHFFYVDSFNDIASYGSIKVNFGPFPNPFSGFMTRS